MSTDNFETGVLSKLSVGQVIPFAGNRWTTVSSSLAETFVQGDRLVVVQETGQLLHIPQAIFELADHAVTEAQVAFAAMGGVTTTEISDFYESFANNLEDSKIFGRIAAANQEDVERAKRAGRSTTRLLIDDKMRTEMICSLRMWRDLQDTRDVLANSVEHPNWEVQERRAPLGVVGFVFEGRPNVFADATGVLRSGNTVVFRIGSDALATAREIMTCALLPALKSSGLPEGAVQLIDSVERSAGYAMFSHQGLCLAVARGSGQAVSQLGAVARQSGIPVSLHGTGGAWIMVADSASPERVTACVRHSLDRKVCNTANVICLPRSPELLAAVLQGITEASASRSTRAVIHCGSVADELEIKQSLKQSDEVELHMQHGEHYLAEEWEWDEQPEVSIRFTESLDESCELFNTYSPRFVVGVISDDESDFENVYRLCEAPFVGDGFTRWVDGQYALARPELGLSNWQHGRLFARGGILSGDGVFSVRYVMHQKDSAQHR